ncbi:YheC/YheD family endospore coat-associated protein [Cohnella nanjingensis]|uniref:YheC/YheD family protein n=1 Tax=Cohnella nanjingensis TaxID=1387779 RepID=A0A7X0RTS8_9BACL|nr:YheC/YheD family protein [Cohnella nanjingensis]MBB6672331.1 YheC/YheD family protein [Cohnella nanjingensis]
MRRGAKADVSSFAETASQGKPVLAILTIDDEIQLFRGNRHNFADLLQTGEAQGFLTYVVTVKNLKLASERVVGYAYDAAKDQWDQAWYPRPNFVYNRIPQREDERLPWVKKKLTAVARHPDMILFNRRFFNKWTLFKWLNETKETRSYVPETRRLTEPLVLSALLKRHPQLYLKPVMGKAGVGIMKVKVLPEKQLPYRLQIQEEKGSRTYHCGTLSRLWTRIRNQSKASGEPYIAQQGIALASVNDRPFDLRALIQKNQNGAWELTGIGARLAGNSSITTHVPRGGSIEDPEKLLVSVFGQEKAQRVFGKVKNTAVLLARQIERSSKNKLCEMSMDLGVDATGHVWFFEANSKPMKFDEPHIRQKSLERIFQYSQYLYRQSQHKGGLYR